MVKVGWGRPAELVGRDAGCEGEFAEANGGPVRESGVDETADDENTGALVTGAGTK